MRRIGMKGKGGYKGIHGIIGIAVVTLFAVATLGFLLSPHAAHAQTAGLVSQAGNWIVLQIGYVLQWAVNLIGRLLLAAINILISITQYNSFGSSDAVNIGWVVVRDLANMLFIISLVVIAFGTVLQWEQYRYNRLLGKLALTVILVNFSKAIALFFIDFSQVIMMTFVNAFKNVAAGNLITGFGLNAMLAYAATSTSVDISLSGTVMIYALAIILLIIALIVTVTLLVVFARRVISLWILIILSPIAWIASVMPGGVGRFNSDWWSKFGKELFVGPTLAFFLWLSFSIIFITSNQGSNSTAEIIKLQQTGNDKFISGVIQTDNSSQEIQAVVSEIGSTQNMFNFIITIALLIHSMSVAREAGGFAGKFAGSMSNKIDQGGKAILKGITKTPGKVASMTGVTGMAKRVGYGMADSSLGVLKKLPLVGGAARTAQSNLRQRRYYKEDKDKRNFQYMSNEDLDKFGGRGLMTEQRRSNYKNAIETKIERGLPLSDKDVDFYHGAVGYRRTVEKDADGNVRGYKEDADDRYSFSKFTEYRKKHLKAFGAKERPADGGPFANEEDEATHLELEKELKGYNSGDFKKLSKDLEDPAVAKAVYNEIQVRKNRITGTAAQGRFINELKRDGTDALQQILASEGGRANPALAEVSESARRRRRFEKEKAMRERLGIGENVKAEDIKRAATGNTEGLSPEVMSAFNAQIAKGVTKKEIADRADQYLAGRSAGTIMSDEQYQNEAKVFAALSASQAAYRKRQLAAGVPEEELSPPDLVAGKDPTQRLKAELDQAQQQGRASTARFAANFDTLGINSDQAGAHFQGEEKKQVVEKLQDIYRKQLQEEGKLTQEEIDQRVTSFGEAADKAENLALANTNRQGYTLGHVLRHEDAHAEVGKLSDQDQEDIFSELPKEEQDRIVNEVSKQWGNDELPEKEKRKQAINEYLTDGMANFGRSDAVGQNLDTDLALIMKERGVKFSSYQEKQFDEQPSVFDEEAELVDQKSKEFEDTFNKLRVGSQLPAGSTFESIKDDEKAFNGLKSQMSKEDFLKLSDAREEYAAEKKRMENTNMFELEALNQRRRQLERSGELKTVRPAQDVSGWDSKNIDEATRGSQPVIAAVSAPIAPEDIVSAIPEQNQTKLMNNLYTEAEQQQIASSLEEAGVIEKGIGAQKGQVIKAFFAEAARRNQGQKSKVNLPDDFFNRASIGMKEEGAQFGETASSPVDFSSQRDQLESAFRKSESALADTEREIRERFQDLQARHNVSSAALSNLGDSLVQKEMKELGVQDEELNQFRQLSDRRNKQREELETSKTKLRNVLSGQLGTTPSASPLKKYMEQQKELIKRWEGVDRKSYEQDAEHQREAWLSVYKDLEDNQPVKSQVEQRLQKYKREAKAEPTPKELDGKRAEYFKEMAEEDESSLPA